MRIHVKIDVMMPLKRRKKISRKNRADFVVSCKNEKLGDFCFLCGLLFHTERFCKKKLEGDSSNIVKEWGSWLRAPVKRGTMEERIKWLRDERDDDWGGKSGANKNQGSNFPNFM